MTFADSWIKRIALSAVALMVAGGVAALNPPGAFGQDAAQNAAAPPVFTDEILTDPKNIEVGEAIWQEQCGHCHGAKAYPGKAPKLKPSRYKPEFVWHRVYKGFRGMPPWGEVYSREELIGVVAYVKSKQFSP